MEFIKLAGTEYPIQFGTGLMKRLGKKYKLPKVVQAEQLISSIEWDDLDWIVESGLNNAANVLGDTNPLNRDEIDKLIDQELNVMPQVLQVLTVQLSPESEEEEPEEEEKKVKAGPVFKK